MKKNGYLFFFPTKKKINKNDQLGEICFDIPFPEGKALFL